MSIGPFRIRKPGLRSVLLAGVWALVAAPLLFAVMGRAAITSNPNAQPTLYPLQNTGSVPPLVMLVMSRDEQLYIKAYTDYTDLTNNGIPDTTYNNSYSYAGYFDPNICYSYDSTVAVSGKNGAGAFKASAAATNHQCGGTTFSGNFMNWVAMSRIDVLRYVMYGGNRVVDTVSPDQTILERSYIPDDLHSWVKVYTGSDINKYTPYTSYPISMCNTSPTTTSEPQIRVAKGAYYTWSATAREQCMWREDATAKYGTPADLNPLDDASSATDKLAVLTARVDVCDNTTYLESFCREYDQTSSTGTVIQHFKPAGLLQRYGENGSLRFGLLSGSYFKPRDGGVLRRDIGLFAGNSSSTACDYEPAVGKVDEVNLTTGQFCNQVDGYEGIINTLSRFRITSWNPNNDDYGSRSPVSGDCPTYGILQRDVSGANGHILDPDGSGGSTTAYQCKDSGNPLAEMYAEALRYIKGANAAGGDTPTAAMIDESNTGGASLLGLPVMKTWLDPYRSPKNGGNAYCAQCSIVVISTGLDSFDSDEIPTVNLNLEAGPATTLVGQMEGLDTKTGSGAPLKYLVGREGALTSTTYQDVCSPYEITDLNQTFGICPDTPSLEGGYQMAGLAYEAWTTDMRPDLTKPAGAMNKVATYAIALAESMPTFEVGVKTSSSTYDRISVTPSCQANNNGGAALNSSSGWRSCYLGNLILTSLGNPDGTGKGSLLMSSNLSEKAWLQVVQQQTPSSSGSGTCGTSTNPCHTFGMPAQYSTDADGVVRQTSGSFEIVWEDSQWGNDHDQDVIELLSYCRGSACTYVSPNNPTSGTKSPVPDICLGASGSSACNSSGGSLGSLGDQTMLVRTEAIAAYAGNALQIGFTMGGANNATGQAAKFTVLRPGGTDGSLLAGSIGGATSWNPPEVEKLTTGPSEQVPLQNPLWFAAKYGGFIDQNNNKKPDLQAEWDSQNNFTGAPGADGVPDNYFLVRNPTQLLNSLTRTFNAILQRSGSGTAAAVVANHVNGIGVAYRATYQSSLSDTQTPPRTVAWTGSLDTLWVDAYGLLRENGTVASPTSCSSGCALSSDYTVDPIAVFTTDPSTNQPEFQECIPVDETTFDPSKFDPTDTSTVTCSTYPLSKLPIVWNAEQQLWSGPTSTYGKGLATQRSYTANANTGRYITTWIDRNKNGVVDPGEQMDFAWNSGSSCTTSTNGFCGAVTTTTTGSGKNKVTTTTTTGNYGFLNTDNATEAQNIVNWIRGVEVSGMRGRTLSFDCATLNLAGCATPGMPSQGTDITLRLGDIVDSTPLVVGAPAEAYDQIYGDKSYATFKAKYRDRRQVVYVGADDGLLHAINGGFYDAANHAIYLQPHNSCSTSGGTTTCSANTSYTADPVGSELWAYAPGNLLAHLRWLTSTGYTHVFYVDGSPVATDAKVFHDDGDCSSFSGTGMCHPYGWGTVLVVPFRLGGGDIKVPVAIDPSKNWDPTGAKCDGTTATNCTWKESFSAYVVLDVTDPEKAPVLLAELTPASSVGGTASTSGGSTTSTLGSQSYTTSEPAFAVMRDPTSSVPSQFVLFIGSGPTSVSQTKVTSTAALRVYAYDLAALACQAGDGGSGCTGASGAPAGTFDMSNGGAVAQGKNSFAGDLIASDFNLNEFAEALYFGSVRDDQSDTPRNYTGSLWKLKIGETPLSCSGGTCNWTPELMYDAKLPITIRPSLGLDSRSAPEVYAGTGRLLDTSDLSSTGQQQILGMIDPDLLPSGDIQSDFSLPLAQGDLLDVTNIGVCVTVVTGTCSAVGNLVNGPSSSVATFTDLQNLFSTSKAKGGYAGFYLKLNAPGTTPSERVISAQALLGGVLITNAYTPGSDSCSSLGTGREFATDYETGTANPSAFSTNSAFGAAANGTGNTSISLGPGLPSSPSLHAGAGNQSNSKTITACTQTSTGAIICQKVASLFPVTSGEVSWREPLDK